MYININVSFVYSFTDNWHCYWLHVWENDFMMMKILICLAHNLGIIIQNWCAIISQQKCSPPPSLPWVLEKLNLIATSLIDLQQRRGIKTTNNLETTYIVKLKEIIFQVGFIQFFAHCESLEYSPILLKETPQRWAMFPYHNLWYAKMFCSFDEGHVVGLPTCTWTGILFPVSCHPMIILSVTPAEILPIIITNPTLTRNNS